jgi:ASC-1-like (ASCH) protein
MSKRRIFFISNKQREIFDFLKSGEKSVETRAATPHNLRAQAGDIAVFLCKPDRLERLILRATHFKSIQDMLKVYRPEQIHPHITTQEALEQMYVSFPGYTEKLGSVGILALELE